MSKRALILGIGGMDGSLLADILLEKNYEVHGLHRRSSVDNLTRVAHVRDRVTLHRGDLLDFTSVARIIDEVDPDEIYNEADQDNVDWSFATSGYSVDVTYRAVANLLEYVRTFNEGRKWAGQAPIRIFQPVSATMFGGAPAPQNENTPLNPQSPYACVKAAAFLLCRHYRREHGMFVSTAILYNHESPRRGEEYLLHKICRGAVRIKMGLQKTLALGNLDARVDIGCAGEYMEAAWRMMQLDRPDDFVICTGQAPTIKEWALEAFRQVGIGSDDAERLLVKDDKFFRPGKTPTLRGDHSKALQAFGFAPRRGISEIIKDLVKYYEG